MTRFLVFGLILLAAFLPLAAIAVAVRAAESLPIAVARVAPAISADAQPVALLALSHFRAPPSR